MEYLCKSIIGPYSGKFSDNIITYFLYDKKGNKVCWHEGPNKPLNCKVGDTLTGIIIDENFIVNYKKSEPIIVKSQLNLFNDI